MNACPPEQLRLTRVKEFRIHAHSSPSKAISLAVQLLPEASGLPCHTHTQRLIRSSSSQNSRFISRQKEMKNDVMPWLYLAFWQLSPVNNRWLLVKLCRAMMMSLEFRNEAKYHEQGKKIVMREKIDLGIEDESILVHGCKAYSTHHMDSKLESHVMHLICHMLESLSIPWGRPSLRIWLWPPILVYKVFAPSCGCSAIILPVPQEIHHHILQQLAAMLGYQAQNSSSKLIWSDLAPPNLSLFSHSITCFADQHIFCLQIDTYLIAKWEQLLSHNLCILKKHLLWYDPRESIIWVPSSWWGCGYIRAAVYNMVAMHAAHATKRSAKEKPHATADKKIKWYIADTRACCTWKRWR